MPLGRERTALFAVALTAGFVLGWQVMERVAPPSGLISEQGVRLNGRYKLVSPLLLCSASEPENFGPYRSLQGTLSGIVASAIKNGEAESISVYVRDTRGQWVGINDTIPYAPASLLKVPLMIAYFKVAESEPSLLGRRITYDGSTDSNSAEVFRSSEVLKPGTYSVYELLKAMVGYSDNNAMALLYKNIDPESLAEIFTDLGLEPPDTSNGMEQSITAKEYSYFFRLLYNATYLTPEDSEKALEMLAIPDFPSGIRSTVPKNVTVAQKFGERSILTSDGGVVERDLHDCGVVYAPSKPYLLCVMTRGKDFNDLTGVIQSIGKAVYAAMQKS